MILVPETCLCVCFWSLALHQLEGFPEGLHEHSGKRFHLPGLEPWFEAELTAPNGNQQHVMHNMTSNPIWG